MSALNAFAQSFLNQPMPWLIVIVTVWTIAVAFIVFALVIVFPPVVRDIHRWSEEAFGKDDPPRVADLETRRRHLNATIAADGRRREP